VIYYRYKAKLDRVIDGDTMDFILDLGFHLHKKVRVRVHDYDAPEVRGAEKVIGLYYKALAQEILEDSVSIVVQTGKGRSFDRWVGDIYVDGTDFKEIMDARVKEDNSTL
jgi:micrococcal nuclease